MLRCALAISEKTGGRHEDWLSIWAWLNLPLSPASTPTPAPTPAHRRLLLASALNQWYGGSTGNSIVEIQGRQIVMRPRSVFLFGMIGLQVASTATATRDCLVCYHCSAFYLPKNKPRTGSRNFCPRCRRQAKPQLYAMRDLRDRQKAAL
jgi:hypothetical protein